MDTSPAVTADPRLGGRPATSDTRPRRPTSALVKKGLLGCGILSSAIYVAMDILATLRYEGYSYVDQSVSELFAVDAPSRTVVVPLMLTYGVVQLAFAVGIWVSAREKRALRVIAGLIVVNELRGFAGTLYAPMNARGGAEMMSNDIWHIILTVANVLVTLLIIGIGATALGRRFRGYSIGTILVMVVVGGLAGLQGGRLAADQPTPWLGIEERVSVYAIMLWYAMLALALLRE
jgi:hypothetical protein